ncbi:MAG: pyridoxamine 5-phosphate oxidase-related FMN-binding protein [Actinomycetia bacterium]|nr:pyridoxamine 5-phosphate oxidase-related FMN-binding protein [Actinomycetes bacterium]
MASWTDIERVAPELATAVRERFEATGLGLLGTLRADGSPRVSGLEPLFALGELWFGMMPDGRKSNDLLRDSRFAIHSATVDKQVNDGDAKISGRALLVEDDAVIARYRAEFAVSGGEPPPPGPMHLFRADVAEMSILRPAGDHLDIRWWTETGGEHQLDRY